uniref:LAM_G_DOMAIN domain-containing protein n=1 Tax=Toxocara canis TaxID=6265 RepID=A0A183U1M2_TOXCA
LIVTRIIGEEALHSHLIMTILEAIQLVTLATGGLLASDVSRSSSPRLYVCPDNTVYYNPKPCNPAYPDQCSHGFACRLSRLLEDRKPTKQFTQICCDSSKMSIADWLVALQLAPQVIPRTPSSTLYSVRVNSFDYNIDSPEAHIDDELQALNFPNYVTANVESVKFNTAVPPAGGFLHVLVLVDAARSQCAIFLNYDIPSEGDMEVSVNVSDSSQQGFYGAVSRLAIPQQTKYRHQYVVLIFHTDRKLSTLANVTADISNYLQQIPYFLSSSTTGRTLGHPIAGTFFYVR